MLYSGRIWLSLWFRHHRQLFRRQIRQISSVVIRSRLVTHSSLCMIHQKTGGDKMWQDHGTMLILTPERTSEDRSDRSADTSLDLYCTLQIRLICAAHYGYIWSTLGCDWFDWSSATPAREGNGRSREQKIFSASSQAFWQGSRRESLSFLVTHPKHCCYGEEYRQFCLENKTISDGGITVDFWFIKVYTSNWSSNNRGTSNSWGSSNTSGSSNSWDNRIVWT